MDWFRWHHGTASDLKFTIIAKRSGQSRGIVLACWAFILEYASTRDDRGSVAGIDPEEIACCLDVEIDQVEKILSAMSEKELIAEGRLTGWNKRQPQREDDSAAERKRRWKEKQQLAELEHIENATERNGTQGNAPEKIREDKNIKTMPEKNPPACPPVINLKKQEHNQRLTWFKNWFVWSCQEITGSRYAFAKSDGCMLDQMLKAVGISELVERSSFYLTLTDETRFPRGAPTIKGLNTMLNQLAGKDGQDLARRDGLLPAAKISLKHFTPWKEPTCQTSTSKTSDQTATQAATG